MERIAEAEHARLIASVRMPERSFRERLFGWLAAINQRESGRPSPRQTSATRSFSSNGLRRPT
jgi:hypothetical protein